MSWVWLYAHESRNDLSRRLLDRRINYRRSGPSDRYGGDSRASVQVGMDGPMPVLRDYVRAQLVAKGWTSNGARGNNEKWKAPPGKGERNEWFSTSLAFAREFGLRESNDR